MPLTEFPLLQDNTRLLKHKDTLYKVKVKYDESTVEANGAGITRKKAHTQIENTFRAILYLIQREATLTLKPIQTENFLISIETSPWSFSQRYGFLQNEKELKSYPLQFEFRVKVQVEGKQDCAISEFESLKGSLSQKYDQSLDTDIVDAKDHSARFTRNSRGSLLHDGKKVVSATDKTQATKEIDSQRARDDPKTNKVLSEDRKIGLKRKLNRSPQNPTKLAKSDDEDKGLEVERFHNRNNSNLSVTSEYSGYRLRDRSSRNFSPVSDLGTRHSERIRARDNLENNDSTYQKHTRSKHKRSSSVDTAGIDSEKNGSKNDDIYPRDPGNSSGVIKDSGILSSELDHSQHTARKLKRNRKDKFENKLDETGTDKITDGEKHCELSQSNKRISEKDASEIDRFKKDGSKRRTAKDSNTSSPKTKKHRLYTENEGTVLIANQKPSITGESVSSPRVSTVLPQKRARPPPNLMSPRITRQRPLVRSPTAQADFIASSPQGQFKAPRETKIEIKLKVNEEAYESMFHHECLGSRQTGRGSFPQPQDEESQRIMRMRQEVPTHSYRDILLAQSRDRHLVEEREREEIDKLRQLYEPTAARRSPRLHAQTTEPSLWRKIVGTFLTPVKKVFTGE